MNNDTLTLYHVGFYKLPHPDIHFGRKNADFGQGFYLSPDEQFVKRWARSQRGFDTYINKYELDTTGLVIKRLERNEEWFDCIFSNRNFKPDGLSQFDVITGPVANDTLYDTFGIITSGRLEGSVALALLKLGNEYIQTVIKTQKAADKLRFISARIMSDEEIASYHNTAADEEQEYQELFARELERLSG
ncbi:MAG: DUF3990 domain-containing protein [Ruminococcus sp.]|nr:DUF3990 domain-containing protein [Ruminococcus sp.]